MSAGGPAERALLDALQRIRAGVLELEGREAPLLSAVHAAHRPSAVNLLHYLGLRRTDARGIQPQLAELGLSSLGHAEAHVLATLDAVISNLSRIAGLPAPEGLPRPPVTHREGRRLVEANAEALFGATPRRAVRIMVTVPREAADDPALVRDLVSAGMDLMRINCAHDGPAEWSRMVENLARARRELGRGCRVLMDLGGPKLRTGAIAPGPEVVKWRPRRDALGRVTAPARVWLTPGEAPPEAADATLPLPRDFLGSLGVGDRLELKDARGAKRTLEISAEAGAGRWAECSKTAYATSGLKVVTRDGERAATIGRLPATGQALLLRRGDTLVLTAGPEPGQPARDGRPASIPCTLPEVFRDVRPGERIWFDDGHIGGVVRAASSEALQVEIVAARPEGSALKADKGINLPDSALRLPPLTPDDLRDLEFVARHADLVGYSFVRTPSDVMALRERLAEAGAPQLGVVLKIETRAAFEHLPRLLLAAMGGPGVAVMIARGDLAVEVGYERLAEVQEEILWVCEAAHVPVIWATQVLETLTREGHPSRAEITDAAMGERAECVMLNKGPHAVEAVRLLDDILVRMRGHADKKRPMLRELKVARDGL